MLLGTTSPHFRTKLKINIFCPTNFKLLFLKKWFSDSVYDFSDCITNYLITLRGYDSVSFENTLFGEGEEGRWIRNSKFHHFDKKG